MTLALLTLGVVVLIVAGIKASEHVRHPENIDPPATAINRVHPQPTEQT